MRFLPLSVLLTATLLVPLLPAGAQAVAPTSLRATPVQLAAAAALRPQASIASERPMLLAHDPYQHGTRREERSSRRSCRHRHGLIVDEPADDPSAGVGGLGLYFYLR
jgi:hypothetical protein